MECIYIKDLIPAAREIEIPPDEIKHLRALRIGDGERILVSNGAGFAFEGDVELRRNKTLAFKVLKTLENFGELPHRLGLALGILSDRNRFEFALEKAVELGATDFFPIIADYSQKISISAERLRAKAIAAMKQCRRSRLINIAEPLKSEKIAYIIKQFDVSFVGDFGGAASSECVSGESRLWIVGPEGGFSERENALFEISRAKAINIAPRRLRAETAAVAGLAIISYL